MLRNPVVRLLLLGLLAGLVASGQARDLEQIREDGVLRHLGIPYANFVTGLGDGLDVELMQGFAQHLGLRYQFVATDWDHAFGDLTGRNARNGGDGQAEFLGSAAVKGDVLANGLTKLAWREQVIDYSDPTFPSGVWLLARADTAMSPITPGDSLEQDVIQVKSHLRGLSVLTKPNTCLDPRLYQIAETGADIRTAGAHIKLNEMAPAILNNDAQTTLLDVPDALIALNKYPGQLKVIGPVSGAQTMGVGFRKNATELREAFNRYLGQIRENGEYNRLVEKYYPTVFAYFDDFFQH